MAIVNLAGTMWQLPSTFINLPVSVANAGKYKIEHDVYLTNGTQYTDREFLFIQTNLSNSINKYLYSYVMNASQKPDVSSSCSISTGSILVFKESVAKEVDTNADNTEKLITWLTTYATQIEPIKVDCSIDFDDEWCHEPGDCHFSYDRVFNITWDIYSGNVYNTITKEEMSGETCKAGAPRVFSYQIGTQSNMVAEQSMSYSEQLNAIYNNGFTRKLERFKYTIKLSELTNGKKFTGGIDELIKHRTADGYLSLIGMLNVKSTNLITYTVNTTKSVYLELPPKVLNKTNISVDIVPEQPVFSKCSWPEAELYTNDSNVDSVDGYCIEMYRKSAIGSDFSPIEGIKLAENKYDDQYHILTKQAVRKDSIEVGQDLSGKTVIFDTSIDYDNILIRTGSYWLCKNPKEICLIKTTTSPATVIETFTKQEKWIPGKHIYTLPDDFGTVEMITETSKAGIKITTEEAFSQQTEREIFIPVDPKNLGAEASHCFYFKPKELGIEPGDSYLIKIYPYNTYTSYIDENGQPQPGARLTNEGTFYTNKTSKGIVRVRTSNSWTEGQVYVFTGTEWKQAEAIYTKTTEGWKETQ